MQPPSIFPDGRKIIAAGHRPQLLKAHEITMLIVKHKSWFYLSLGSVKTKRNKIFIKIENRNKEKTLSSLA